MYVSRASDPKDFGDIYKDAIFKTSMCSCRSGRIRRGVCVISNMHEEILYMYPVLKSGTFPSFIPI
jgi:hypothetical protein